MRRRRMFEWDRGRLTVRWRGRERLNAWLSWHHRRPRVYRSALLTVWTGLGLTVRLYR